MAIGTYPTSNLETAEIHAQVPHYQRLDVFNPLGQAKMANPYCNFEAYLARKCPGEAFKISVLSNAFINGVTVRTTRMGPVLATSYPCLRDETTFIVKHAPEYVINMPDTSPYSLLQQANLRTAI
jgi:hypothetical protein